MRKWWRRADLQGWNGRHPVFERLIEELRPTVIMDIGVWKGQSAIYMATALKQFDIDGAVIAIDTWLGSPEHWLGKARNMRPSLRIRNGHPTLYETFHQNVLKSGLEDYVVPFPQTSLNAAEILARRKISAQLIHIDAAHQTQRVLEDARAYWSLLDPGGALVGDDLGWESVKAAADLFAEELGIPYEIQEPKWIIRKPEDWAVQ